ncbi:MAG: ABC transporter substrate-binding protein [Candidatus Thorarchaeota archaeon]|jgi:peptide/nickel transport system substrate-binding protein
MKLKKRVGLLSLAMLLCLPVGVPVLAQDDVMTFVMAYPSDIGELNPLLWRSERSHWYDMLVYDTLISYDENMLAIPWLAEAYSISADGLTVTFTIRTGATWHDGTALTPADVKFSIEYYRDGPEDVNAWSFLQHVDTVTVSGNDVVVVFDQVFSFALGQLGELYMLPEHIRGGTNQTALVWNDPDNATAHIGSGPFSFVERVEDEYTELARYDGWWGPNNVEVGQIPDIEVVRIDVVRGQDARILAMRAGEADTERYEVFGAYVNTILNAPELQLVTGVASQWDYILGFNTRLPGLDDTEVRRAISYAINRQELINIGRLGFGTETNSTIPEVFFPDLYSVVNSFPAQDIAMANQILDDAGYLDHDSDNVREFPGASATELAFDLWVLSWDDISVATGTGLRVQLEEVGFDINVVITDDDPMYEGIYQTSTQTFEMYTMADGYDPYPDHPWERMHSENDVDWGSNPFGWVNTTFDDALDAYMAATPAQIDAASALVQEYAVDNMPYIPLYLSDDTHALRAEWEGFTTPPGGPFTSYNPLTMVLMTDTGMATTPPPTGGFDIVMLVGVGAVALVVGIVCTYALLKRQ